MLWVETPYQPIPPGVNPAQQLACDHLVTGMYISRAEKRALVSVQLSAFCSVKPVAACSSTLNEADFQQPESSARFSHVGTLAPASNPRSAAPNRHAHSGQKPPASADQHFRLQKSKSPVFTLAGSSDVHSPADIQTFRLIIFQKNFSSHGANELHSQTFVRPITINCFH